MLQKILETGLHEVDFGLVNSVLVLGLGGGSVIISLREKFKYGGLIHAVELNETIIAVAKEEFGIQPSNNLIIEQHDAFEFVKTATGNFDLIIVDLFIDNIVPSQFLTAEFCQNLYRLSNRYILFNIGLNNDGITNSTTPTTYFETQKCNCKRLEKVQKRNTLLLIEKLVISTE